MKLGHVGITIQAIDAVLYEMKDGVRVPRKMPFKLRYKLSKIKDVLQSDVDAFEQERVKLVHEYGTETEVDGEKRIEVVDEDKLAKFNEALREVYLTDIVTKFEPLTEADIEPIGEVEIDVTEDQLRAFMSFVVEQKAVAEPAKPE